MSKSMKGTYNHNIDAKGRLIVPAKIRDSLGSECVITQGLDDCLYIYSDEEWENFTARLDALGNKEKARNIKTFFRANAADCDIDGQGRTVIPAKLRESVGITKEVVIFGNGEKAEIWPADKWEDKMDAPKLSKEQIKADLEDIEF